MLILLREMGDGDGKEGRRVLGMARYRSQQMAQLNRKRSAINKMPRGEARDRALANLDAAQSRLNANYLRTLNKNPQAI